MRYGAVLPNQTLKPTRVFWFAPRFVRTNRLEVSRARLSFVSLDVEEVQCHEHVNAKGGR
jgi:hypothetical protein